MEDLVLTLERLVLMHRINSIKAVISQLEPGSMVRMHMVQGFEYANATLNNGDVVGVVLPSEYIEVRTPIVIGVRVYVIKR